MRSSPVLVLCIECGEEHYKPAHDESDKAMTCFSCRYYKPDKKTGRTEMKAGHTTAHKRQDHLGKCGMVTDRPESYNTRVKE